MINIYEIFEQSVMEHGDEILRSPGMTASKDYIQHGTTSVYEHSVSVAAMCLALSKRLSIKADEKALIRGALLHDYFLYDWHCKSDWHKWHGFTHAKRALKNADRDFKLTDVERNMIESHMFPLNFKLPRYRESVLLCLADKICTLHEFFHGKKKA